MDPDERRLLERQIALLEQQNELLRRILYPIESTEMRRRVKQIMADGRRDLEYGA